MEKSTEAAIPPAAGYRALMAAVIGRALDDLKDTGLFCRRTERDRAMAFILGEDCEAWCLELGVDFVALREKAAALYRLIIEKEDLRGGLEKRPGRPAKGLKRDNTRHRPGKPRIATGR